MTGYSDLDLRINDFARRSFRDVADMDYIAARLALRARLLPQFLWLSLQALEKYLKYILLVNRVPALKVGHDIRKALALIRSHVNFVDDLKPDAHEVFAQIANSGADRYLTTSYYVVGPVLPQLDAAVWDVRRYCQILRPPAGAPAVEQGVFVLQLEALVNARAKPHLYRIAGGKLEEILGSPEHPARPALCWQNAFFGHRRRTSVRAHNVMQATNAPLTLYPEMIDELARLIHIPGGIADAFRTLRDGIAAGTVERP